MENYLEVSTLVSTALSGGGIVGWLTPGHPTILDSVSQLLLNECAANGWKAEVIPGVSSIDTILADVAYDPAAGLLVADATTLVARRVELNPKVGLILFQPSVFNSDFPRMTGKSPSVALGPLKDYLLTTYRSNHPCAFVRSSMGQESETSVAWSSIGELDSCPSDWILGSSLYIPHERDNGVPRPDGWPNRGKSITGTTHPQP